MDIQEAYNLLSANIGEFKSDTHDFQKDTRKDLGEIKSRVIVLETKDSQKGHVWKWASGIAGAIIIALTVSHLIPKV